MDFVWLTGVDRELRTEETEKGYEGARNISVKGAERTVNPLCLKSLRREFREPLKGLTKLHWNSVSKTSRICAHSVSSARVAIKSSSCLLLPKDMFFYSVSCILKPTSSGKLCLANSSDRLPVYNLITLPVDTHSTIIKGWCLHDYLENDYLRSLVVECFLNCLIMDLIAISKWYYYKSSVHGYIK